MNIARRVSRMTMIMAFAILSGCAQNPHEKDRFVAVAMNINLPYWQEAQAGFKDAARQLGVKVEFLGTPDFNPPEQKRLFDQAVSSRPSGILVSPSDANLLKASIDAAIQQGIPVLCFDSDSPESQRLLFVGTNNYEAGRRGAQVLGKLLAGKGSIAFLTIQGQYNLAERLRGYQDGLKAYPGIKTAATIDDRGDPGLANDLVTKSWAEHPDLKAFVSVESTGGRSAAEVAYRLGRLGQITIVAFDRDEETLYWIGQGAISATIAQKPYTMTFYGLKFLDDLHHNFLREFKDWRASPVSPLPAVLDTGIAVIDRSNLEAFQKALRRTPQT